MLMQQQHILFEVAAHSKYPTYQPGLSINMWHKISTLNTVNLHSRSLCRFERLKQLHEYLLLAPGTA